VVDGVGADDLDRLADVDAEQAGGANEEGVGGDAEAGSDGPADVFSARGDNVEGGGGAEVDDNDGRVGSCWLLVAGCWLLVGGQGSVPEDLQRGDAVDDAVGAHLGGIVGEDGQAGADAGLDEQRLDVAVELGGAAQGGVERRHDRGDGNAGDLGDVQRAQGEEVAEDDAKLVDGGVAVGGDAPVGEQGGGRAGSGEAVEAEDRVGVADVDGEEHERKLLVAGC